MTEMKDCAACKYVDKAKSFLTKEHTPMERTLMAGGLFFTGLLIGGIIGAVRKKK